MKTLTVYLADDEKNIRRAIQLILAGQTKHFEAFESAEALMTAFTLRPADVVFLDVKLPGIDGLTALKAIKEQHPTTEVVMISGHATLSTAIEATRAGAYDFLEKPIKKEKLLLTLQHISERRKLKQQFTELQKTISERYQIIGESPVILKILQTIQKIAPTDSKVLITGESGVGKELVAYAIHQQSKRAENAFVKLNCAAIPEELIESELFGSEKGAYTGATERREGKFLLADGGTLFLDEVGDMSLRVQTKVLRVLQDGEFQRVGGTETLKCDVRIIAATNRNLEEMVQAGKFREDLYFRLNVLPIHIPPLRERKADIPLLIEHFSQQFCKRNDRRPPKFEPAVIKQLTHYHWPGNIRELQNIVERLIILSDGDVVTTTDLPEQFIPSAEQHFRITPGSKTLAEVREIAERTYIRKCLEATGGNISQAAKLLGMERSNLHKKMKSLGMV
jgi:two-component system nitrogen regulation response regulator NtrX